MRQPFYSTPSRAKAFCAEANSWIGTPFRQASSVKGPFGGVDCVGLAAALHFACGACAPFEFKRLPLDWHLHHKESPLACFLGSPEARARMQRIEADAPKISGDLVLLKTGLCEYHLLNYLRDELGEHYIHVPLCGRVARWALLDERLRGYITSIYRIMEAP